MFARIVSAMMIIGGVVWASWPVPALLLMDRAWTGATGYFVMSSVAVGSLCLGFAAAAILFGNLDRLQGAPAFLGSIGAAGALLTLGGFYAGGMVLLPIGSAALFRDLARSGVVSARLARFHGAAGVLSAIPAFVLIASQGIAANAIPYVWLLIAMPAYAFSWVPIGWSLRDGAWMPEEPAADS